MIGEPSPGLAVEVKFGVNSQGAELLHFVIELAMAATMPR